MKTKLVFAALLLMIGVAQVKAGESGPSLKISHKDGSGIFLVNYLSTQTEDVRVTIKDITGRVLITESVKGVKGFSLPVNLEGVGEGVYTIEVGNKTAKQVETLNYLNQTPSTYTHVTRIADNKYMLSFAHPGTEKITITILDDAGNAVYKKEELIDGSFAKVYELEKFAGTPSFEVTDVSGSSLIIK